MPQENVHIRPDREESQANPSPDHSGQNAAAGSDAPMKAAVLRYVSAVVATIFATLLRMALAPLVGAAVPFAIYFGAVLLVAWYCGFRPAALSIVISAIAGSYFFISPATTPPFFLAARVDRVTVGGFVVGSLALAFLLAAQRRTFELVQHEVIRRRDAEDMERENRQWYETTLASVGDAVIATDADSNVVFMNSVASALTGWDSAQARGLPLRNVFHIVNEQTNDEVEGPVETVIKEGVVVGLANHTVLIAKDGRRIPLDDSGAPIKRDGRIVGAVLVFRDVTERRNVQMQIERSERRYRLFFESSPQPMWVYDRDTLAFLAVNTAAVKQYGFTADEFLQMTLKDIRPPEEIAALMDDLRQPTKELHRDGPWRHRKRDGTIIDVEIAAHPIEFEARKACLVLATDVTERTHLEEQLHQARRLESIGRLAGGVAHDFNNLLTVINGYAAEILTDLPANSPLTHQVAEISAAGNRAAALTEQLLAFSRRRPIQPRVLNLNNVIVDIEQMLRRLIGENINLVVKLFPQLGNIKADISQLHQVIINLAANARDAMPRGGSLVLETSIVSLDEAFCAVHSDVRPGAYVKLGVTDTGMGMAPEVRQRIFEPFFTTKPTGSGTGLGLAMVHGTVLQSRGCIRVHSESGAGTTFEIYFPRTDEVDLPQKQKTKDEVRGSETVLVVEDQTDVRRLIVTMLSRFGYQVISASGGEEAIRLANNFPDTIHLLLADIVMPSMDGYELAKRLAVGRGRPLRVLFMSGYPQNTAADGGVLDAGLEYIQKPFTPEALAGKVRAILER